MLNITNNDIGSVIFGDAEFRDELLTFDGSGTVVEGTILARKAVDDAIVVTAGGGNTGNGTAVAVVVGGSIVPIPGNYVLTNILVVAEGGVFKLEDPNGNFVADLTLDIGAGGTTILVAGGIQISVTEGGTDFILADSFSLALVANGKMVPFAIAGLGGAQVPNAVITFDSIAAGAGDEAIRAMIAGKVRKQRLIIDADGDGSNITDEILDQLRDFTVVSVDVQELNKLDNQ